MVCRLFFRKYPRISQRVLSVFDGLDGSAEIIPGRQAAVRIFYLVNLIELPPAISLMLGASSSLLELRVHLMMRIKRREPPLRAADPGSLPIRNNATVYRKVQTVIKGHRVGLL